MPQPRSSTSTTTVPSPPSPSYRLARRGASSPPASRAFSSRFTTASMIMAWSRSSGGRPFARSSAMAPAGSPRASAADGVERVSQLVCDLRRHLPDRREALRVEQAALEVAPVGDVADDHHDAEIAAIARAHRGVGRLPAALLLLDDRVRGAGVV